MRPAVEIETAKRGGQKNGGERLARKFHNVLLLGITGTVDSLLKPENKDQLASVLTYHVLPGRLTTADLKEAVKDGGGQATFKTVQGEPPRLPKKAALSMSPIRKDAPPASRSPTFCNRTA